MKIPKDKQNEKGEYSLKDEDFSKAPKKDAPRNYQLTQKEIDEHEAFVEKIKKEIKKGLK